MRRLLLFLTLIGITSVSYGQIETNWNISPESNAAVFGSVVDIEDDGTKYYYITGIHYSNTLFGQAVQDGGVGGDFFVAKLNDSGSPVWIVTGGSSFGDSGVDIAYDPVFDEVMMIGSVGIGAAGTTNYSVYDTGLSVPIGTTQGGQDVFFISISAATGEYVYFDNYGGANNDRGRGIVTDKSTGDIYLTGDYRGNVNTAYFGVDEFATAQFFGSTGNTTDAFIAKYNPNFELQWHSNPLGNGSETGYDIELISFNSTLYCYSVGEFDTDFLNVVNVSAGGSDFYVLGLDASDGSLAEWNYSGTGGQDVMTALISDGSNLYISGYFDFNDPLPFFNGPTLTSNGNEDMFLAKFSADPVSVGSYDWVINVGTANVDQAWDLAFYLPEFDPVIIGDLDGQFYIGRFDTSDGSLIDQKTFASSNSPRAITGFFEGPGFVGGDSFASEAFFSFTPIAEPIVEIDNSRADWGDYDGDGDLDVAVTGIFSTSPNVYRTYIYTNNSGSFVQSFVLDNGRDLGSIEWIDWDGDQDLDLFQWGNGNTDGDLLLNNGSGFDPVSLGLPTGIEGKATLGDIDNDGDIDVIITNAAGDPYATQYFENVNGTFQSQDIGIPNIGFGVAELGDLDEDGDLDLMIAGLEGNSSSSVPKIQVLLNDNGQYTTGWTGSLTEVGFADIEFGDINRDGFLDAVVMGDLLTADPNIQVYINNGSNSFSPTYSVGGGLADGSIDLGDYDNDGDVDILATGWDISDVPQTIIYTNDGTGAFFEIDPLMIGVSFGSGQWGDYDADGDLDVLILGLDDQSDMNIDIYRNDATLSFNAAPPNAPDGLTSTVNGASVTLNWNKTGGDVITFDEALTYNIRVGTSPGASDIISPSSLTNGERIITRGGNVDQNDSWTITLDQDGTFYWSVQAIDQGFVGSVFATEQSFTIAPLAQLTEVFSLAGTGNLLSLNWVNYNGDGLLDFAFTGSDLNQIHGATDVNQFQLDNEFDSVLATYQYGTNDFADWNNDNVPDMLTSGTFATLNGGMQVLNNKTPYAQVLVPGVTASYWIDIDNDGVEDIWQENLSDSRILKVTPSGVDNLTSILGDNFADLQNGSSDVGDYDNDGDMDILTVGFLGNDPVTILYRNEGGSFIDSGNSFTGVSGNDSKSRLVDYNSDGWLDVVVIGDDVGLTQIIQFYTNQQDGTFILETDIGALTGNYTILDFGDYDNDGDMDVAATGSGTTIFEMVDGKYVQVSNFSQGGPQIGDVKWGDHDNDGDLDLLFLNSGGIISLYQNDQSILNTPPSVPANLGFEQIANTIRLFWDGSTDDFTPGEAISYNVYIGTTSTGTDILGPLAHTQGADVGLKFTVDIGNAGYTEELYFNALNLPSGDYFWSVQAVDGAYKGSAFAAESTFSFTPTDSDAPVIAISSSPLIQLTGDNTQIVANISDENSFSAQLRWLPLTQLGDGFDQNTLDPSTWNLGTQSGDLEFTHTFADTDFDDVGIVYFIYAEDALGNAVANADLQFRVIRTDFQATDVSGFTTGNQQTDYRLVSFPQEANENVSTVFADYGSYDNTVWRLFRYTNENFQELSFNSSLSPGEGYWFITTQNTTPKISGNAVPFSLDAPFSITLGSGWNAIGNPYLFSLNWEKVIAYNITRGNISGGTSLEALYTYSGGWSTSTSINAFQGAYVESPGSVTIELPPFIDLVPLSRTKESTTNEIDSENWRLEINLANESTYYNISEVGMNPQAVIETDEFDGKTLPFLFEHLDIKFDGHENDFSRDIVNTQENYTWTFEVRSSYEDELTTIDWKNDYFGDNDRQLYLKDLATSQLINMREDNSYSFKVKENKSFQILYGDDEYIKNNGLSESTVFNSIYPNPASDFVNISFTLPASSVLNNVSMDIVDVMGRQVSRVFNGELSEGFHKISWDRRLQSGSKAVNGVYLVKMRVNDKEYTQRLILK